MLIVTHLVDYTTNVVCVNFIHKWQDLQFKVDSERYILKNLSWQYSLLGEFLARNLLGGSQCRIIVSYVFDDI